MPVDLGFPSVSKTRGGNQGVAYIRPELALRFDEYLRIRDVIDGEDAIKRRKAKYLPMPNADDTSRENLARYQAYLTRAVFYSVTERTLSGLLGQVFFRKATMTIPPVLDPLEDDASGDNQTLEQVATTICGYGLAYGRGGLMVDYPDTLDPETGEPTATTVAAQDAGDIRPTIKTFAPWHITNWRSVTRNAEEVLTLVVIYEGFDYEDDGFEQKTVAQWRVLQLIDNVYTVSIWRKTDVNNNNQATALFVYDVYQPRDSTGATFDKIPFLFVGSKSNNSSIDRAPLGPLASLNIAHYRNSADYEESCYLVGQPTPVFAGLTETWVKDVLKGKVVFGSRSAIPLPVGGMATLLQAAPNTMIKEAMDGKERQMVALGAKLVQQTAVQRTATEATYEENAENSVLTTVAKNVSAGMLWALQWCARFTGADPDAIKYTLSTEFDVSFMTAADLAQLVKTWQAGAIAFTEMRARLALSGVATLDDAAAIEAIAEETANAMAANPLVFDTTPKPVAPTGEPGGNGPPAAGGPPAKPGAPAAPIVVKPGPRVPGKA